MALNILQVKVDLDQPTPSSKQEDSVGVSMRAGVSSVWHMIFRASLISDQKYATRHRLALADQ